MWDESKSVVRRTLAVVTVVTLIAFRPALSAAEVPQAVAGANERHGNSATTPFEVPNSLLKIWTKPEFVQKVLRDTIRRSCKRATQSGPTPSGTRRGEPAISLCWT